MLTRLKYKNSDTISNEGYIYNTAGRLVEYTKSNINGIYSELTGLTQDTSLTPDKWTWVYKYNYAGMREQKHLLTSPHGDDGFGSGPDYKIFTHNWEYYMTGAFGEEIVQYKGFQTSSGLVYGNGRKVFLGAHRYRVSGELQLHIDGSKEVNFTDNNGSVRLTVHNGGGIHQYDYKPFGDTLWTSAGTMNRDNFDGSTYDAESDLQMLGFRMYDNETGRFTTPDLLWSAFPAQTPYHYAYNSPLTYRDPTGLAPEKEKEREELMGDAIYPCTGPCDDNHQGQRRENSFTSLYSGIQTIISNATSLIGSRTSEIGSAPDDLGEGGSGVGGSSSSMLATYTDNTMNSMFQSLLAQHLDVGPTGGPMISSGGGFGGGTDTDFGSNLFGLPDQIENHNIGNGYKSNNLIINRIKETQYSTLSEFHFENNDLKGFILEPGGPSSSKSGSQLRIPSGNYGLEYKYSTTFKMKMLFLTGVVGRNSIMLHWGNYPSNATGCLVVGTTWGYGTDKNWKESGFNFDKHYQVFHSQVMYDRILELFFIYKINNIRVQINEISK